MNDVEKKKIIVENATKANEKKRPPHTHTYTHKEKRKKMKRLGGQRKSPITGSDSKWFRKILLANGNIFVHCKLYIYNTYWP